MSHVLAIHGDLDELQTKREENVKENLQVNSRIVCKSLQKHIPFQTQAHAKWLKSKHLMAFYSVLTLKQQTTP